MTVLQRTDLTTSQKIQCAAAAVAGQHAHGSKTALSDTYEISRPTVYAVGAAAESVLRSHFETPLLQGAAVDVRVDDAQLRRAVVALRVLAPNAIHASSASQVQAKRCRSVSDFHENPALATIASSRGSIGCRFAWRGVFQSRLFAAVGMGGFTSGTIHHEEVRDGRH